MGVVITLGTVVPLVLCLISVAVGAGRGAMMAVAAILLLFQGYFPRLLTLRVGIYPPLR